MIDAHCHMQFQKFEKDADAVIKDAFANGLTHLVNTGTSINSSQKAIELAEKYDNTYAIVGIHPHHADKMTVGHPEQSEGSHGNSGNLDSSAVPQNDNRNWQIDELEKLAHDPKVIGIGEIGMDYHSYKSNGIVEKELQEDAFRKQIELSIKLSLPIQIHTRLAWDDTLQILSDYRDKLQNPPGMFHCFSGDIDFTRRVLEMGFYVGFDGNITYGGVPPGETTALAELVDFVPSDRILTETDAPFLSPIPYRGERNVPKNIKIILEFIAQRKGISYNTFEAQVEHNFRSVFSI